jgi:hypothetical protein
VVWAGKPHRITSVSLRAAAADLLHPACTAEFELLSHKPGKKKKHKNKPSVCEPKNDNR